MRRVEQGIERNRVTGGDILLRLFPVFCADVDIQFLYRHGFFLFFLFQKMNWLRADHTADIPADSDRPAAEHTAVNAADSGKF
ncbi:hypothetical protein SDC9_209831 [bioreactor metagenome]|uniref:Uncharacterized protein n=1 Tax=bioreactor metagenome TaxID=1076179 RepID=A0A645JED4_9ZZZZ